MNSQNIIFLSPHDPRDPQKWSGTIYSIYRALETDPRGLTVIPVHAEKLTFLARALSALLRRAGWNLDVRFSTPFALVAGLMLTIRLWFVADGPIVAVAASNYVPYLKTRRRIVYISDATFQAICELYPSFNSFPAWLKRQGHDNEERTLTKADHVIYPSQWAARSAVTHYGIAKDKISELPFGPNIPAALIEKYVAPKSLAGGEIRIVFVSADWVRKNGDLAVETCRILRDSGLNARLITIGSTPEHIKRIDFVEDRGFLRKSDPRELEKMCAAYRDAHFLLLPSTADAFGIVFSEAQAFGAIPATYDVGGIGSAVVNGESGLLLPLGSPAEKFAQEMAAIYQGCRTLRRAVATLPPLVSRTGELAELGETDPASDAGIRRELRSTPHRPPQPKRAFSLRCEDHIGRLRPCSVKGLQRLRPQLEIGPERIIVLDI